MKTWRLIPLAAALVVVLAGTTITPSAFANDEREFPVMFTNGLGIRLRAEPSYGAPTFSGTGAKSLPEGAVFVAQCEEYGDWVTNTVGDSSNVYMRSAEGAWTSSVWLYTGTNGRTGLPLCSELTKPGATKIVAGDPKPTGDITTDGWAYDDTLVSIPFNPNVRLEANRDNVAAHCNIQRRVGYHLAADLCDHYLRGPGGIWVLDTSDVAAREEPLRAMFEWQMRNGIDSHMSDIKKVDPDKAKTFSWGTKWFRYEATAPLTDVYQALRKFSIAQKGDIWVGPRDQTGDRPIQIRYRSFLVDRYDFNAEYFDEWILAQNGWAQPFEIHGQSELIVYETTLSKLDPWSTPFYAKQDVLFIK